MISLLCVGVTEIAVGVVIAVILVGGLGSHIAHKIWAKKHGKCGCGCDCSSCSGCGICPTAKKEKKS